MMHWCQMKLLGKKKKRKGREKTLFSLPFAENNSALHLGMSHQLWPRRLSRSGRGWQAGKIYSWYNANVKKPPRVLTIWRPNASSRLDSFATCVHWHCNSQRSGWAHVSGKQALTEGWEQARLARAERRSAETISDSAASGWLTQAHRVWSGSRGRPLGMRREEEGSLSWPGVGRRWKGRLLGQGSDPEGPARSKNRCETEAVNVLGAKGICPGGDDPK